MLCMLTSDLKKILCYLRMAEVPESPIFRDFRSVPEDFPGRVTEKQVPSISSDIDYRKSFTILLTLRSYVIWEKKWNTLMTLFENLICAGIKCSSKADYKFPLCIKVQYLFY